MRTSWHSILGCGLGPVSCLSPQVRILAGPVLFVACTVAPATTATGIVFTAMAAASWVAACGTPLRVVRSFALFGLAVLLPYVLLVPLIWAWGPSRPDPWWAAMAPPWGILWHGMAGILVSTCTATTLTPSHLRDGMLRLPVPSVASAILLQIVHQTPELVYETRRVASAMAVRGASAGWWTSLRLVASIPRVWLPRLLVRAERVGAAMEVRGYCETDTHGPRHPSMTRVDAVTLWVTVAVLALALGLRLGGIG